MEQNNNIVPKNVELDETIYDTDKIKNLIYNIRGKQVMLDSDVAMLYHYETKNINKSMKRNIERFPEDFCFRLTENEINSLRFQTGTLNKNGRGQRSKYLPYGLYSARHYNAFRTTSKRLIPFLHFMI